LAGKPDDEIAPQGAPHGDPVGELAGVLDPRTGVLYGRAERRRVRPGVGWPAWHIGGQAWRGGQPPLAGRAAVGV
jgi:hypothetical protein